MDEVIDDIIMYLMINCFDLPTLKSFFLTSKRMNKFKDQYMIKQKIIKELLGDQGFELINVITSLDPNTKNLLIPTVPYVMKTLIEVLTFMRVKFKRCNMNDIYRYSIGEYIKTNDFHIMIMNPQCLEGQTIYNVDNVLIYNNHKYSSVHRALIIHKSNNIRHINTKKINYIDIGDKGDL